MYNDDGEEDFYYAPTLKRVIGKNSNSNGQLNGKKSTKTMSHKSIAGRTDAGGKVTYDYHHGAMEDHNNDGSNSHTPSEAVCQSPASAGAATEASAYFVRDEDDEGSGAVGSDDDESDLDDDGASVERPEERCYRRVFRDADGLFRSGVMSVYCRTDEGLGPWRGPTVCLEDIVPQLKVYPTAKDKKQVQKPQVDTGADTGAGNDLCSSPNVPGLSPSNAAVSSPPTAVHSPPDDTDSLFVSMDTPAGMKESPASRYMRGEVEGDGPGVVFPIDAAVNRAALQKWLCGGTEDVGGATTAASAASTATESLPWCTTLTFDQANIRTSPAHALTAIRALSIPTDSVHVGYINTVPAQLGLIAANDAATVQQLLALIPNSKVSFDLTRDSVDIRMRAIYPFLKAKSQSDPDAVALADKYQQRVGVGLGLLGSNAAAAAPVLTSTSLGGEGAKRLPLEPTKADQIRLREKGYDAVERKLQQDLAAARKANNLLRTKQEDPWALASYLLGRHVTRPPSGSPYLLSDEDAAALQWSFRGEGGVCRWLCVDFEAAAVGKLESALPVEVACVEAFPGNVSSLKLLHAAFADHSNASSPAMDDFLADVSASTCYYSLVCPGMISDVATAAKLSLLACGSGKSTLSGHGIPYDGLLHSMRSDYVALAEELVEVMGLGKVLSAESSLLPSNDGSTGSNAKIVLVNKGPTLVDYMSLRWCLAAANYQSANSPPPTLADSSRVPPLYDLESFEKALAIPMFDISTVGKLAGLVQHALEVAAERKKAQGTGADNEDNATDHPHTMTRRETSAAATAAVASLKRLQPLKLPKEMGTRMLCACAYHWDLYSTGTASAIAKEARESSAEGRRMLLQQEDIIDDVGDEDEHSVPRDDDLDIDIHCARSDAYFLKCQLENYLSQI